MTNRLGLSLSSGSSFSATFKGFTGVFLTWVLPTAWLESLAFSLLARLKLAMSVKVIFYKVSFARPEPREFRCQIKNKALPPTFI